MHVEVLIETLEKGRFRPRKCTRPIRALITEVVPGGAVEYVDVIHVNVSAGGKLTREDAPIEHALARAAGRYRAGVNRARRPEP